jgi:hypothetical protein
MPGMMGADRVICARCGTVRGTVNCPAGTGGCGLSAGCGARGPGCGLVRRDKMGAVRRRDDRGGGLEVMAVEAGAGRVALLPVMCAGPSGAAR